MDLIEFDVSIELVRRTTGAPEAPEIKVRETSTFTTRVPCLDEQHARDAADNLGLLINEASGGAWKLTDNVTVVPVTSDG